MVGGPGKIKENLAFQPLRTGYARPAQSAAAGGASPEESPEETIDRLARGALAKEPRPASLGGSPDLRRSACSTRILPMAMDRPGTGAARTAADDAQAQRGLTMEFGRGVPLPLDCGIPLGPFTLAYQTYGPLNAARSNAILVCHALTGDQYLAGIHPVTGKSGGWRGRLEERRVGTKCVS